MQALLCAIDTLIHQFSVLNQYVSKWLPLHILKPNLELSFDTGQLQRDEASRALEIRFRWVDLSFVQNKFYGVHKS